MKTAPTFDPRFLEALEALDQGVFCGEHEPALSPERPPLTAMLVMPCPPRQSPRDRRGTLKLRVRKDAVGVMSAWAASWMVLATCLSASAAGFAFHVELSDMIGRWEQQRVIRPQAPDPGMLTAVNTIEIARAAR